MDRADGLAGRRDLDAVAHVDEQRPLATSSCAKQR
jgi:hypothetical protein